MIAALGGASTLSTVTPTDDDVVLFAALSVARASSVCPTPSSPAGVAQAYSYDVPPAEARPVEAPPGVEPTGVVVAGHPILPPRFSGLEDELLASPMLHHPPFAAEVRKWVGLWSDDFSDWMPSYLSRMTSFESMVDRELAERGLPWSLRFLPVIESGYSTTAVSSASACRSPGRFSAVMACVS